MINHIRTVAALCRGMLLVSTLSGCLVGELLGDHCDGDFAIDVMTDLNHCGGCHQRCAPPNAIGRCDEGQCVIDRCEEGWHPEKVCTCLYRGEEACNGIDDNCDGVVDETCTCDPGEVEICEGPDIGLCRAGERQCNADGEWGQCAGRIAPTEETCDGLDQDCDGQTDEGIGGARCSECGEVACIDGAIVCDERVTPTLEDTGFRWAQPNPDQLSTALTPDGQLFVASYADPSEALIIDEAGQIVGRVPGVGSYPAVACDASTCVIGGYNDDRGAIEWRSLDGGSGELLVAPLYLAAPSWLSLVEGRPTAALWREAEADSRMVSVDLMSGAQRPGPALRTLGTGWYVATVPSGWLIVDGGALSWHPDVGSQWPVPGADNAVLVRATVQTTTEGETRRLYWRDRDTGEVRWVRVGADAASDIGSVEWPGQTLAAGHSGQSVWLAGIGAAPLADQIIYRRQSGTEAWFSLTNVGFRKDATLGGPYVWGDIERGRMWMTCMAWEPGGSPEVRVFASAPASPECREEEP